jgi:hypothetical protein
MKTRKCKYCRELFEPSVFLQKNCFEPNCVTAWINEVKQKNWQKKKAKLKADLMTLSDYTKILQQLVNKYVRLRDKGLPCISCQKPIVGKVDAGHMYSVGNYPSVRFDEKNINAQCLNCNQYNGGMINDYRINFVKKYSESELNTLDRLAHETRKFSIPELKEMIEKYKKKCKELELH